jgi:hypothetical protein
LLNWKKHNKYPLSPAEKELAAALNFPAPPLKPVTALDLREQRETTKYTAIYASNPLSNESIILEEKPEPYAGQIQWQEVPYIQEINPEGVKTPQTTRLAAVKKYKPTLFKEGVHGGRTINHALTPNVQPVTDYDYRAVKYIKLTFVRQDEVKKHASWTGKTVTPYNRISFWYDSQKRLISIPSREYERCSDEKRVREQEDYIRERLAVPLIGAGLIAGMWRALDYVFYEPRPPTRHYRR